MIELIISLLGAVVGGGFGWLNRKTDSQLEIAKLQLERDRMGHELAIRDRMIEQTKAELDSAERISVKEGDAQVDMARMKTIAEVEHADQTSAAEIEAAGRLGWLFVFVSAWRKAIRPLLTTLYAGASVTMVSALVWLLMQNFNKLSAAEQFDLEKFALAWLFGQAASIGAFWFVARGPSK